MQKQTSVESATVDMMRELLITDKLSDAQVKSLLTKQWTANKDLEESYRARIKSIQLDIAKSRQEKEFLKGQYE